MLPKSYLSAREQGEKYYFTDQPCGYGHIAPRYVGNNGCVACQRERTQKWREKNPAAARASARKSKKAYYQRNRKKVCAATSAYQKANRPKVNAARRRNYAADPEKRLSKNREWRAANHNKATAVEREYRQRNRGAVNQRRREYQARKSGQVPPWADRDAMRRIYDEAARLTEETGVQHHVDHIVPLKGEVVSGLHVVENLQILTATENIGKSNRFEGGW